MHVNPQFHDQLTMNSLGIHIRDSPERFEFFDLGQRIAVVEGKVWLHYPCVG